MKLDETFELPFPRARAWAAFQDVPLLVSCLPGATLRSAPGATPLELAFEVKLGPIAARFSGEGSIAYADDCSGTLSGSGVDRTTQSRVKGSAAFALEEVAAGTRVRLGIEYALTGALAQFGRPGIVKDLAAHITAQFAANLQSRIGELGAAPSPQKTGAAPLEPAPARGAELAAGRMLWSVLWMRLKRWVGVR